MRVMVTGGAGFVGSHVVEALVAAGHTVTVVDDLSTGSAANLDPAEVRLAEVDVRDADGLDREFALTRPELVFHLAAQTDVRRSVADPATDAAVNVLGSLRVFAAAARTGTARVVNFSTGGAIYGSAATVPTPETAPALPLSPYGLGKLTAERYAELAGELHGLEVVTLRPANIYGPRQSPHGDGGVVALFGSAALEGRCPTIYGSGAQTRDFVHVRDVAAAALAAATPPGLRHRVFNVGTGVETSVRELAAAVAAAADRGPGELPPRFEPARPGEVERSCLAVGRAADELGFEVSMSLAVGLADTLGWLRGIRTTG